MNFRKEEAEMREWTVPVVEELEVTETKSYTQTSDIEQMGVGVGPKS